MEAVYTEYEVTIPLWLTKLSYLSLLVFQRSDLIILCGIILGDKLRQWPD